MCPGNTAATGPGKCYCGHDCSRCIIYKATCTDDATMRRQAQEFYQAEFHIHVPLDQVRCLGGRSSDVFALSRDCPFRRCCRQKQLSFCTACADYPCTGLAAYLAKYVNKCLQVAEGG